MSDPSRFARAESGARHPDNSPGGAFGDFILYCSPWGSVAKVAILHDVDELVVYLFAGDFISAGADLLLRSVTSRALGTEALQSATLGARVVFVGTAKVE
jgi:hypothetical protein